MRTTRSTVRAACVAVALAASSCVAAGATAGAVVSPPTVTAGAVDVVATKGHHDAVKIPITLSTSSSLAIAVHWKVQAISAVVGRDVAAGSGVATFKPGELVQWVSVTVWPSAPGPGTPCFFQSHATCRTFSLALTVPDGRAVVAAAADVDAILIPSAEVTSGGASMGDLFVAPPTNGPSVRVAVPISLGTTRTVSTVATLTYHSVTAQSPQDFRVVQTRVTIPAGSAVADVPVLVSPVGRHRSASVFSITVSLSHGTVTRATGVVVVQSASGGAIAPSPLVGSQATLTQDINHTSDTGDTYIASGTATSPLFTAASSNVGGNSRALWWPSSEVVGVDTQACATWTSQSPAQGNQVLTQQGIALDVASQNGVVRALTVTKNVWGYDNTIFNVHVWDTTQATPFTLLAASHLGATLPLTLPWDICARVTGGSFQFIVWAQGTTPPAWGSSTQGGTVAVIPAWGSGVVGFYIGHLAANNSAAMANLTVGVSGMAFDGHTF